MRTLMHPRSSPRCVAKEPPARVLPGLLLVAFLAGLAVFMARYTHPVGAVALGVLLGLVVGNLVPPGPRARPGIAFAGKRLLAAAVVLLGLKVVVADAVWFLFPVAVAAGTVVVAMGLAWMIGRWWGVSPGLSTMIGAGTGICGVAAVAAVRPVVQGRDEETTYAVAVITLLGSTGLVVFPLIQLIWHPLDPGGFGALTGAVLHSVPQAVGAGFSGGGEDAGTVATVVKLTRVALLGPAILVLVVIMKFAQRGDTVKASSKIPVEVWGFLAVVLVGNLFPVPEALRDLALSTSGLLLVVALTALGLSTRFRELHAAGGRPLLLALTVWLLVTLAVLFVLRQVGPVAV